MSTHSTQFKNFMVKPRTLTAVTTLGEVDSGKTIFLNSTTEFAVTLPKVKEGLNFTFIVKGAPSGASYTIVTAESEPLFYGQIFTSDINSETDADFNIVGAETLTFADGVAVKGDRIEMISDGTSWYLKGFCTAYNAITITISSSRSSSVSSSISSSLSTSASSSLSTSASSSTSSSVSSSISRSLSTSASSSVSPSAS